MHAVVKDTQPWFSHAWKTSFQSVRIRPRLGVYYGKKGLLLASDFAAAFRGRGYTVRAIASNSHIRYLTCP